MSGMPAAMRVSFNAARRNAIQMQIITLMTMIVIGTLSGLATIDRKLASPIDPKYATQNSRNITPATAGFVHHLYRTNMSAKTMQQMVINHAGCVAALTAFL